MLDHIGLPVSDYPKSKRFFEQALSPLGYDLIVELGGAAAGFGAAGKPDLWIHQGQPTAPIHLAFSSRDCAPVDAFHRAAMAAGGRDNGPAGPRPRYHRHYYGAYRGCP